MTFSQPFWLLLAVPMIFLLRAWPAASRSLLLIRSAGLLFLLLALAGYGVIWEKQRGSVMVVVDRSLSMPGGDWAQETLTLLQKSKPEGAQLGVVAFGGDVALEKLPDDRDFSGFQQDPGPDGSNLNQALKRAAELIPENGAGRILVLSDGHWTGSDPLNGAREAAARGLAVDYRHISQERIGDLAIAHLEAPETVGPSQGFMVHAWIQAPFEEEIRYELKRGETLLSQGTRMVQKGRNRLIFRDMAGDPGVLGYRLAIRSLSRENDPVTQNNTASFLVGVKGPKPLLLISPQSNSSLAGLLTAGGVAVDNQTPDQVPWNLANLAGYSGVILENVPAQDLGHEAMVTLVTWVRETGTGLLMTGGKNSFGPGGYFKSPLEDLLPVTMELRQEHRKLSLAMVVALDRSGSMGASVGDGRTKMELANLASAQALDLLSSMDEFGHLAVDSEAHEIVPLQQLNNPDQIRNLILRVDSGGGGIYVFEALSKAARMLTQATAGARHILLFADAADAEEPGKYRELLKKCTDGGITVSVVALGSKADPDAPLLEEIATLGGGNVYFTNRPEDLPRIFAQDTFVVSRSTFIEEPTDTRLTAGMLGLTSQPFQNSPRLNGYNLCYLKPEASMGLVSQDDYQAPIVAFHHVGAGRAAGFMGEAGGDFSQGLAAWSEVGTFFTSLARWTSGDASSAPGNSLLTQTLESGMLRVTLHLDPKRQTDPFTGAPEISLLRGQPGQVPEKEKLTMSWETADSLQASIMLKGNETLLPTVRLPQGSWSLSPTRLPYSPEYEPQDPGKGVVTLAQMAQISGGREESRLSQLWDSLPESSVIQPLTTPLLIAALILLLLEVLERRTTALTLIWRGALAHRLRTNAVSSSQAPAVKGKSKVAKPAESPKSQPEDEAATPMAQPSRSSLHGALSKARDRARSQTER